jgi:hypothetical protein
MYIYFENCVCQNHIYLCILVSNTISILDDARLTVIRRMSLVEQELLNLPEHLSSPPVLVGFVSHIVFRVQM